MIKLARPKIDERVYKNAVLFFMKYCNNQYLHATKMNKLLYYLDFVYFRDHKKSVTGDVYIHQEYGLVPSRINEILATLKNEGTIDIEVVDYKDGELICFEFKNPKKIDESVFSPEQKKLLKQICDEFGNWPTEKIVAQTHLEAPWFYSKPYEIVDYAYARDIDFFRQQYVAPMSWVYIEREHFVRMCEKVGVSIIVRDAIKLWAPTVSRFELSRQKVVYRSPKNRYEAWATGIPNPDCNKGKSGGYRIVYFLDLTENTINLDFIEERKELGFRDEGYRKKDRYNDYIRELKEYLKKLDA